MSPAACKPKADSEVVDPCRPTTLGTGFAPLLQAIVNTMDAQAGPSSNKLVVPTASDRDNFAASVIALLRNDPPATNRMQPNCGLPASYRLVRIADPNAGDVVVAAEIDAKGTPNPSLYWGTYATRAGSAPPGRDLVVEVPHPLFDHNTWREGADLFLQGRARFFLMTGAHRCANPMPTTCSGKTDVCGAPNVMVPFAISDAAHSLAVPFFGVHSLLSQKFAELSFLQLHREGSTGCPAALLSDGSRSFPKTGSIVTLSAALDRAGVVVGHCNERPISDGGVDAASDGGADAGTDSSALVYPNPACALCGETNVEARFTAGSADACLKQGPTQNRLILFEQSAALAENPSGSRKGYQVVIDAVLGSFPAR